MSLRPRYSLLTLLVLTALIAGGVKWWYGPHRVVEWVPENAEYEYTYTRNWRGEKILHGPRIERVSSKAGILGLVEVTYYRDGQRLPWVYRIHRNDVHDPEYISLKDLELVAKYPEEDQRCKKVIEHERQRFIDQGSIFYDWFLPDNRGGLREGPPRVRK
jgi:hypothetical protein